MNVIHSITSIFFILLGNLVFVQVLSAQTTIPPVAFSHSGGFYSEPISLMLSHPDPNVTIYYTLDGSEPSHQNLNGKSYQYMPIYRQPNRELEERRYYSYRYQLGDTIRVTNRSAEPDYFTQFQTTYEDTIQPYYFPVQPVFKGTVVRAMAMHSDGNRSEITTHTYFLKGTGKNPYRFPVLSIVSQEDHLFDYERGIYVPGKFFDTRNPNRDDGGALANYNRRGISWERPASLEVFEIETGIRAYQQNMGIRIHGGFSRARPMKSLRLYARSDYGTSRFHYPLFSELEDANFNRLLLRNSGNDWQLSMFRDALMSNFISHLSFDTQAYEPHIVFLNGEYWGIHNMRERYDRHYLARVHNADPDNVDLLTSFGQVKEGSNTHYVETMNYIRNNDLTDSAHYEHIHTRIDVDNFREYQIAQIFVANRDWPGNNIDFWRVSTDEYLPDAPRHLDGRWRWLAYDLDFGFLFNPDGLQNNTLLHALGEISHPFGNPSWSTELLRNFMKNEEFRKDFALQFADQLNTAFHPETLVPVIEEMADNLRPEMPEHIARWSTPVGGMEGWEGRIENELIYFAENRHHHIRGHLEDYFGADDSHPVTINVSHRDGGLINLNTLSLSEETVGISEDFWPWTGLYYDNFNISLAAEAAEGFEFSHWTVNRDEFTDVRITILPDTSFFVKAHFHPLSTGAEEIEQLPTHTVIHQNYPNPFNPETTFRFELSTESHTRLIIYDITGREISRLINRTLPAGTHHLRWNASHLSSGVYLYRLETGDFSQTRKMILLK